MIQRFYLLDIYLIEVRRYANKNKFPCECLWCGNTPNQTGLEQLKDSSVGQRIDIKWTITQVIKGMGHTDSFTNRNESPVLLLLKNV